jgi:hypothetical protein
MLAPREALNDDIEATRLKAKEVQRSLVNEIVSHLWRWTEDQRPRRFGGHPGGHSKNENPGH